MSATHSLEHAALANGAANGAPYGAASGAGTMTAPPECLAFHLGDEEYAIDLLRVMELRSFEAPTRIAGAGSHILGVLNLRGTIVPIVDLRCRLGLAARYDNDTVTVVSNLRGRTVGVVVDSVNDVVALAAKDVRPAPEFSGTVDTRHITGIATVAQAERQRMLILLDLETLLTSVTGELG